MRVLIDHSAAVNQLAGVGRFARHIVPALVAARPGWDVTLGYAPGGPHHAAALAEARSAMANGPAPRWREWPLGRDRANQLWYRARLPVPAQVFSGRADVVYSPDFTVPPAGRTPRLVTVHDLAFRLRPDLVPPRLVRFLERTVVRSAQRVARVVTVSQSARRDLIEHLGMPDSCVSVVPNGVDEEFFAARPLDAPARAVIGLPASYLLCVGTIEPRKNHRGLWQALAGPGHDIDVPLVVVGRPGWQADAILRDAGPLVASGRVIVLEDIDNATLPAIYAGAAATVYPSWYEGFGLPVIESLAAGRPAVVSTAAALVEAGGDQVIVTDPGDPESIANGIRIALGAGQRAPGAETARRARAGWYRWDRAAEALAETIERVYDERRR
ncbi:MAG: glycosyltransferase family 4 protein [Chloroflexota bacterium]|nr:glycosyltransferase family 4 protein [Chloroflexota bacterium]